MLAVNPTGGWALQLDPLPADGGDDDGLVISTLDLPPFSHASRMPTGPAGEHFTGLSGTRPVLVALPDPAEAGGAVVNGAGIVKDLSLHRVELDGLPTGGTVEVRFVQWAPKGGGFAFVGRARAPSKTPGPYQLWHADWSHTGKRSCSCRQLLAGRRINAALGPPFRWSPNGRQLLVKLVPDHLVSAACDAPSCRDALLEHYTTTTTVVVEPQVGGAVLVVGPPEGRPLLYQPWVGLVPADATDYDPGFTITVPPAADHSGAGGSTVGEGEPFAIVTTPANVEVWRFSKPSGAVVRAATIRGAVVEQVLPGGRLLMRRARARGESAARGGDQPTEFQQPDYFIRLLSLPDGAAGAEIELQGVLSRL